jgi:hypothetical protein
MFVPMYVMLSLNNEWFLEQTLQDCILAMCFFIRIGNTAYVIPKEHGMSSLCLILKEMDIHERGFDGIGSISDL